MTKTNRLGFSDAIAPDTERHDFYITLNNANFSGKDSFEVTVSVRFENGEILKDCFYLGQGGTSEFRSTVIQKEANPQWHETTRIQFPPKQFDRLHLYFLVKSVSESGKDKEVCFGYLPLCVNRLIVPDVEHSIILYNLPKNDIDPLFYIKPGSTDPITKAKLVRQSDVLKIKTFLCSTTMTNNEALAAVLNWGTIQPERIPDSLNRLTFVQPNELIKV